MNRLANIAALAGFLIMLAPIAVQCQPAPRPVPVVVANPPSAPVPVAGAVSVSNLAASPLSVRDVDRVSKQSFSHMISIQFLNGALDSSPNPVPVFGSYTVPAGKRLQIEDISAVVYVPSGQKSHIYIRLVPPNGDPFLIRRRYLTLAFQMTDSLSDIFVTGEPVRIYLEPGAQIEAYGRRTATSGSGFAEINIQGQLSDLP